MVPFLLLFALKLQLSDANIGIGCSTTKINEKTYYNTTLYDTTCQDFRLKDPGKLLQKSITEGNNMKHVFICSCFTSFTYNRSNN